MRIKELRQEMNMRQIDLAERLSIAQATLSGYESGKFQPDIEALRKMAEIFGVSVDYLIGGDMSTGRPAIRIPVYGDVAAGIPIEAIEDIVDYEEIDAAMAATGEYFGLRIRGRSMEPRIKEGDVVIVRKQEDADSGDTVIVLVNGNSATCKVIRKEQAGLSLIPNNPAYNIKFYSKQDIKDLPVKIIGKVVELRGKF